MRRMGAAFTGLVAAGGLFAQPAINADTLAPFLSAAATRRVDVVGFGDSNELLGGTGWDDGWGRALALRFGMYATGLLAPGENQGAGASAGYLYQGFATGSAGQFLYSGAPAFHDALMSPSVGMRPYNYAHVPGGSSVVSNFNLGLLLEPTCPINVNANLRFRGVTGVFTGAGGAFTPTVRLQQPPYTTLATAPQPTSGAGAADGVTESALDLPAGQRDAYLNYRITPFGDPIDGPFIWYYMRAENLDRARGASFHTLYGYDGQSARDMAAALQAADDSYLTLFFAQVRALQPSPGRVLIHVNSGLRDLRETDPSVGPSPQSPGSSAGAFADNLRAIILRIGGVWALNGWDPTELFFLFTVSHPISDPDDPMLLEYRDAAGQVALETPRAASVRLDALTNAGEMLTNNWYNFFGADRYHLTQPAYEELARRELQALRSTDCWADMNADGVVNFSDLNRLLTWFGVPAAPASPFTNAKGDINADGVVDFADLNALLGAFGHACPSNLP